MGLCHPNTVLGDEVWVMRAIRVPFVLRPLEPTDAGCAGKYSFLGDCFLDGIMERGVRRKGESDRTTCSNDLDKGLSL